MLPSQDLPHLQRELFSLSLSQDDVVEFMEDQHCQHLAIKSHSLKRGIPVLVNFLWNWSSKSSQLVDDVVSQLSPETVYWSDAASSHSTNIYNLKHQFQPLW